MSNDIFEEELSNSGPSIDPEKNYFEELVGEGKKYKDEIAAGRAIVEKDAFIEQLKREAEEMRQDLRSRISVEEALTKLSSSNDTNTGRESGQATSHHEEQVGESKPSTTTDVDIKKLVEEELSAREKLNAQKAAEQRQQANLQTVREKLTEAYGPNYAGEVKRKAQELGVSTQFLTEAGAKEPNALFRLLGVDQSKGYRDITDPAPARSQVNTAATPSNSGQRTNSYYQKMRKEDPKRFWSAEVQSQRHKDALSMGEAFFQ